MPSWFVHDNFAEIPECASHLPLAVVFAQLVAVECDQDPFEQDELRRSLRLASVPQELLRWFVRLLQAGELTAMGRPVGGGPLRLVPADHWHADDVVERVVLSTYSRLRPFDPSAPHDTWLFLPEEQFLALWDEIRDRVQGPFASAPASRSAHRPKPTPTPEAIRTDGQLLDIKAVEVIVGLKRSSIYKLIGEEAFPSQIKVGGRALWHRKQLEDWIRSLNGDDAASSA